MYKSVSLPLIVYLFQIDPSGMWKQRDIEIIQYNIVDKYCNIKVVKIPDSDLYGVFIHLNYLIIYIPPQKQIYKFK